MQERLKHGRGAVGYIPQKEVFLPNGGTILQHDGIGDIIKCGLDLG